MTEQQARRPPLTPKPSVAATHGNQTEANGIAALRGASSAFKPAKEQKPTVSQKSTPALSAAAAARKQWKNNAVIKDEASQKQSVSPSRGRSNRSLNLQNLEVPTIQHVQTSHSPVRRSASTLAARVASTSASPSRGREIEPIRYQTPLRRDQIRQNRSQTQIPASRPTSSALSGATVSMAANSAVQESSKAHKPSTKLDFSHIPSFSRNFSPTPSKPSPSISSPNHSFSRYSARDGIANNRQIPLSSNTRYDQESEAVTSEDESSGSLNRSPAILITPTSYYPRNDDYFGNVTSDSPGDDTKSTAVPVRTSKGRKAPETAKSFESHNHAQSYKSGMTASHLADAMVASSLASTLASSRAASPARLKPPPPPIPRRRSRSLNVLGSRSRHHTVSQHLDVSNDKAMMPVRPMKQTLRKHSSDHEDDDSEPQKRGRRHWMRKHPNMHHEGDRKRWRDKVTDRERKRYEGVWAGNRGLLQEYDAPDVNNSPEHPLVSNHDLVLNVVVRDIWERSRLPRDVLEEIWDLVAPEGSKCLNREEFVIGLWLIDLRLKGRKLPSQISPSVWSSVRHTQGVKVSRKPLKG